MAAVAEVSWFEGNAHLFTDEDALGLRLNLLCRPNVLPCNTCVLFSGVQVYY